MRNLMLLLFFAGALLQSQAQDNAISFHKNELTLSVVHPFFNEFKVGYERYFSDKFGMLVSPSFIYFDDTDEERFGISIQLEPRFYLIANNLVRKSGNRGGVYVSPFLKAKYLNVHEPNQYDAWLSSTYHENSSDRFIFGGGLLFGYKTIQYDKLVIDLNFGVLARRYHQDDDINYDKVNYFDSTFSGIGPYGNFSFGFLF